jgi:hypothetical protein
VRTFFVSDQSKNGEAIFEETQEEGGQTRSRELRSNLAASFAVPFLQASHKHAFAS